MLCEKCKAAIPSPAARSKRVNEALHKLGLGYFSSMTEAFHAIDFALIAEGFASTVEATKESGNERSFHACVGDGKWLHITWYRMETGTYEVTAYVN
jgi:hypothetical protein